MRAVTFGLIDGWRQVAIIKVGPIVPTVKMEDSELRTKSQ
jgi:hypothetical protein